MEKKQNPAGDQGKWFTGVFLACFFFVFLLAFCWRFLGVMQGNLPKIMGLDKCN